MLIGEKKKAGGSTGTGTYVVLLLSLGAMTFFGVCSPQGPQGDLAGKAAAVDGEDVSNTEFARAYERFSEQLRRQYGDDYNPYALRVAQQVMDQLVDERILYLKANELGLTATDSEVVRYLTSQLEEFFDKDGKFSEERFRNFLRNNRYSEATFQEELRRFLTLQKLRQFITNTAYVSSKAVDMDFRLAETKLNVEYLKLDPTTLKLDVSAQEINDFLAKAENKEKVKAWYDSHKSEYSQPEKAHASHILIAFKGARNASPEAEKRSKEEARQKAAQVLAQVKSPGADFSELAKKNTDEPKGQTSGGDLGYFTRDSMVKEFSDAAFALSSGGVSDIVESGFGFHIIKLHDKKPAKETALEEASPLIAKTFILQEQGPKIAEQRAEEILAALKQDPNAGEAVKKYGLEWQKTGEIALTSRFIPGLGAKQELTDAVIGLRKDKPLYDKVVKSGQTHYVLRLVDFKEADMSKLTADKRKQLAASGAFTQGYGFYSTFEGQARKEYEQRKAVYKNPAYLALDTPKSQE